jgi:hypothetical protein
MKALGIVSVALVLLVMLSGCAAGPNSAVNTADDKGVTAGFWRGLWHGLISPVTFIISLFTRAVHLYEVHNNGGWYNFGFMLGVSIIFGGGAGGASRRSRRRD